LLDQTHFYSRVRKGVGTFRTRYDPASHWKPTSAGEMPEQVKGR
jgi:hypothetical protein